MEVYKLRAKLFSEFRADPPGRHNHPREYQLCRYMLSGLEEEEARRMRLSAAERDPLDDMCLRMIIKSYRKELDKFVHV